MSSKPSPYQPEEAPSAWAVFGWAFIGFYFIMGFVAIVLAMPLAGLQLLNDYVLHRGQEWEYQFWPRLELFLAIVGVASLLIYVIVGPRVEPSLFRGRRRYFLSVAGFALGFALFAAFLWLDHVPYGSEPNPHYEWWQGWG
jgi:hypothetical protein